VRSGVGGGRRGHGPVFGAAEEPADAGGFDLLQPSLLLRAEAGIGLVRQWLATILRAQGGAPEVAREWWTELRNAAVIARQPGQTVGGRAIVGRIEFVGGLTPIASLERIDQRTADADARHESDAGEHLSREPRDTRRLTTEPHRDGRVAGRPGQRRLVFFFPGFWLAHDAGLPSVRTIRTRFWRSPAPKRSSAAANSRSTIM